MNTRKKYDYVERSHYEFSVESLVEMFKGDEIGIPSYQRAYSWNRVMASRFIESLILDLPVPNLIFTRRKNYKFDVLDGMNRLKSIIDFFEGDFKLSNLQVLSDLNGYRYIDLPQSEKDRLSRYNIGALVISTDNDSSVLEIFSRLNSGGQSLTTLETLRSMNNNSEIVNQAEYIIKSLEGNKNLLGQFSKNRQEEIVIRFLCLRNAKDLYTLPLTSYIQSIDEMALRPDNLTAFFESLLTIYEILGEFSFKKFTDIKTENHDLRDLEVYNLSQSILLSKHSPSVAESQLVSFSLFYRQQIIENQESIARDLIELYKSQEFILATRSINSKQSALYRINSQTEILRKYCDDVTSP